jgi:hypothetical protein
MPWQFLVTEWFMTLNAVACTVLLISAGFAQEGRMMVKSRDALYGRSIRSTVILGLLGAVAASFAGWGVKRGLCGDRPTGNIYQDQIRFGPNNTKERRMRSLVFNYIYDIPFLKANRGLFGKTPGGWEVSGVSIDQAGVGPAMAASRGSCQGFSQCPRLARSAIQEKASFAGRVRRSGISGCVKNFAVREKMKCQLRAEASIS